MRVLAEFGWLVTEVLPKAFLTTTLESALATRVVFPRIKSMLFSRDDKHIGQRYLAEKLVGKFETQYRSVPGARFGHRLALRMTKATESCINFHCDGGYASSTPPSTRAVLSASTPKTKSSRSPELSARSSDTHQRCSTESQG